MTYLECPCCGDDGAAADGEGWFFDGQPLICGCSGWVSVNADEDDDPWINNGDAPCPRCTPEEARSVRRVGQTRRRDTAERAIVEALEATLAALREQLGQLRRVESWQIADECSQYDGVMWVRSADLAALLTNFPASQEK